MSQRRKRKKRRRLNRRTRSALVIVRKFLGSSQTPQVGPDNREALFTRSTSLPTRKPSQTGSSRSSKHHSQKRLLLPLRLIRLLLSWQRQHLQHSSRPRAPPHWSIHRSRSEER